MNNFKLNYTGNQINELLQKTDETDLSTYATKSYVDQEIGDIDIPEIEVDNELSLTSTNAIANNVITGQIQTIDRYNEPIVTEGSPIALSLNLPLSSYEQGKIIKLSAMNLPIITSWVKRPTTATSDIKKVCYGNNQFVAVGSGGTILKSYDGITWDAKTVGSNRLNSVCYGNNKYIAIGDNGTVLISIDGDTWEQQTTTFTSTLTDICFGNNEYVIITGNGIYSSIDGIEWEHKKNITTSSQLLSICYANGIYVIGGYKGIFTSTDLTTWTTYNSGVRFHGVNYCNGLYIAVGVYDGGNYYGYIYISEDGYNWTVAYNAGARIFFQDVCYGNGMYVAIGYFSYGSSTARMYISHDTSNWKECALGVTVSQLNGIDYYNNQFVAVGSSTTILTCSMDLPKYEKPTLNINSLGAKIVNGTIEYGQNYTLVYNGDGWDINNNGGTAKDYMPASSIITSFWSGTQAEYDALIDKSATTLYLIGE